MWTLLRELRERAARDSDEPLRTRARKARVFATSLATAKYHLRAADRVGARARTIGRPDIRNEGRLEIGDDLVLTSTWVPSHIHVLPGGSVTIANHVHINYGAGIASQSSIIIEDGVHIGPYAMILDTDFHGLQDKLRTSARTEPIVIEQNAWLAHRVSVLRGARIGARSVIAAGSVVSGEIPPDVIAGGIPAKIIRPLYPEDEARKENAS